MNHSSEYIRGFTEYIILSILSKFDSYGYEMTKVIHTVSDSYFSLTEATLYFALKRMEEDGQITSYYDKNKKGMTRKLYKITPKGLEELAHFRNDWKVIEQNISNLVGGGFDYYKDE
jgi:PadR family transcriptional regulator PadR